MNLMPVYITMHTRTLSASKQCADTHSISSVPPLLCPPVAHLVLPTCACELTGSCIYIAHIISTVVPDGPGAMPFLVLAQKSHHAAGCISCIGPASLYTGRPGCASVPPITDSVGAVYSRHFQGATRNPISDVFAQSPYVHLLSLGRPPWDL